MIKNYAIYIVLLLLSFGLSYRASLPEEAGVSSQIDWIDFPAGSIERIIFEGKEESVSITRTTSTVGPRYWVAHQDKDKEGKVAETKRFRTNDRFEAFLEWLSPIRALRVLGSAKDLNLADFGLEAADSTLQLEGAGKQLKFRIGARSYGSKNVYVLDEIQGRVLLVSGSEIENIQRSDERLLERDLTRISLDDVLGAKLQAGEQNKVLAHTARDKSGKLAWSDPPSAGSTELKPKSNYQSWMGKVNKLKVLRYAKQDEINELAEVEPFLVIVYEGRSGPLERFEFKKVSGKKKEKYWVYTQHLDGYAAVSESRIDTIEKDIAAILGK